MIENEYNANLSCTERRYEPIDKKSLGKYFNRRIAMHEECPYLELFWSVFSRIWTENGEIGSISSYSLRMRENTDQNNSKYGQFLRSVKGKAFLLIDIL